MQRWFVFVLCCAASAACSAPQGSSQVEQQARRVRVQMVDLRSGREFELVSQSHTNQVELYSEQRANANTKVQSDEVMVELVDFLGENGLGEYGRAGKLPLGSSSNGANNAFEIETDGGIVYWKVGANASLEERQALNLCLSNFLALYSSTLGLQRVENSAGADVFERPTPPKPQGKP